jgi:hypothetical protein
VTIGTLQKASLAAIAWFVCSVITWQRIYSIVWPPERRIPAIQEGRYPIDVGPPLPVIACIAGFAIPTILVALLVMLYRYGTREESR